VTVAVDDLLPISALQHLLFCERQCALIHVEGLWAETRLTAEGRVLHESPDRGERSGRGGVVVERDVPVCSERLQLYGKADVVESRRHADGAKEAYPVEYKRGKRAPRDADEVQLCAQAMCLEEMLQRPVRYGAIFHGASRRRRVVEFSSDLRALTEETVRRLRGLLASKATPAPCPGPKCRSCSLADLCQPAVTAVPEAASAYLTRIAEGLP
jgi:CRISPR-associated exonuclease Cas4